MNELDQSLSKFIKTMQKSKVAVIIPLFGYDKSKKNNPVDSSVLKIVMDRVFSYIHLLTFVFVGEENKLDKKTQDLLIGYAQGGNVIMAKAKGSYIDYLKEGWQAAIETDAQFILCINPWVLLQEGGIDTILDRINFSDNAKIVSGFSIIEELKKDNNFDFDTFSPTLPIKEERDLSFDFLGMPRYIAEMIEFDDNYKTHKGLQTDLWQTMYQKGFEVITTQHIPIFPFGFPWQDYEKEAEIINDEQHFTEKWRFSVKF